MCTTRRLRIPVYEYGSASTRPVRVPSTGYRYGSKAVPSTGPRVPGTRIREYVVYMKRGKAEVLVESEFASTVKMHVKSFYDRKLGLGFGQP